MRSENFSERKSWEIQFWNNFIREKNIKLKLPDVLIIVQAAGMENLIGRMGSVRFGSGFQFKI